MSRTDEQDTWLYPWANPDYSTAKTNQTLIAHIDIPMSLKWNWSSCCQLKHKVFMWLLISKIIIASFATNEYWKPETTYSSPALLPWHAGDISALHSCPNSLFMTTSWTSCKSFKSHFIWKSSLRSIGVSGRHAMTSYSMTSDHHSTDAGTPSKMNLTLSSVERKERNSMPCNHGSKTLDSFLIYHM